MSAPRCPHCGILNLGHAWVNDDGEVLHASCAEEYERTKRGLVHRCPLCHGAGKVVDMSRPERRMEREPNPNAWGSGDGMMCVEYTVHPHRKPCDLCVGEGWLDKPPVPVTETKQVGWRRS